MSAWDRERREALELVIKRSRRALPGAPENGESRDPNIARSHRLLHRQGCIYSGLMGHNGLLDREPHFPEKENQSPENCFCVRVRRGHFFLGHLLCFL